jgi:hypothetical protein
MDVILIILGVMGFGAIIISTYVFMVAARNYVSDDQRPFRGNPRESGQHAMVERSPTDRRKGNPVTFPLAVNGILIAQDRRVLPDRRATT